MKNGEKIVLGVLLMIFSFLVFSNASARDITISNSNSIKTCDEKNVDWYMYAGTQDYQIADNFSNSDTANVWQFDFGASDVKTYKAFQNAVTVPTLTWLSEGKPHNVNEVVVVGATGKGLSVSSTVPSTYKRSDIAAQIVYHISRIKRKYVAGSDNKMEYHSTSNPSVKQTYYYSYSIPTQTFAGDECFNIHIGFCGDGILDNGSSSYSSSASAALKGGEECDPNDPNKTNWGEMGCSTSCKKKNAVCGDGTKSPSEECDPNDTSKTGWGDGCSTSCKPTYKPKCGEIGEDYNSSFPTARVTVTTPGLCKKGTLKAGSLKGPNDSTIGKGKYEWYCVNDGEEKKCGTSDKYCGDGNRDTGNEECDRNDSSKTNWGEMGCSTSCKKKDAVCGDGTKSSSEECDRNDSSKTNWGEMGCSTSCKKKDAVCGDGTKSPSEECDPNDTSKTGWGDGCSSECKATYNGVECGTIEKKYNSNFPTPRITSTTPGLCKIGSYVNGSIKGPDDSSIGKGNYFWSCEKLGVTASCSSSDDYCGDGKVQTDYEICDPNDTSKTNWGEMGCSVSCKKQDPVCGDGIKSPSEECDPNDPNHTNWGTDGCSASCQKKDKPEPEITPLCSSTYSGSLYNANYPIALLNADLNLCKKGEVTNFVGPVEPGRTYSWKCNGSAGKTPADCSAQEMWCGDGVKNGSEACDGEDGAGEYGCNSSCEQNSPTLVPDISKKIENEQPSYLSGDSILFKITFKNTSSDVLSNVVIRDFIPLNVKYVSSEIKGVSGAKKRTYLSGGIQEILEYSGFSMNPNDEGYVLVKGTVLGINKEYRGNVACVYHKEAKNCVSINPYKLGNRSFGVEKKVEGTSTFVEGVDSYVTYLIKIYSKEGKYNTLNVVDSLPDGLTGSSPTVSIVTGSTTTSVVTQSLSFSEGKLSLILNFPNEFKTRNGSHDTVVLRFKVKISGNKGEYVNNVCVKDEDNNKECDDSEPIYIVEGATCNSEYAKDIYNVNYPAALLNADLVLCNPGEVTSFVGPVEPGRTYSWTCNGEAGTTPADCSAQEMWCGDGKRNGSEACDPKDTENKEGWGEGTCNDSCEVVLSDCGDGKKDVDEECDPNDKDRIGWGPGSNGCNSDCKTVIVDKTCGNGKRDRNEKGEREACDLGSLGGIIGSEGYLFSDHSVSAPDYSGSQCSMSCEIVANPACFNVQNGSISIMKGEMLPFYWNIEGLLGTHDKYERQEYLTGNFFHSKKESCSASTYSLIDLDTMVCHYKILGPGKEIIYDFDVDCVGINGWGNNDEYSSYYPAIQDYIRQNRLGFLNGSLLNKSGIGGDSFESLNNWTDFPLLMSNSSKLIITNFGKPGAKLWKGKGTYQSLDSKNINNYGEYKLSLESVSYKRCLDDGNDASGNINYRLKPGEERQRVCTVDFSVTDHYFVQKSVYGTVNQETQDRLSKYRTLEGNYLFEGLVEKDTDQNYKIPSNSDGNFDTFIKKYAKNAESIDMTRTDRNRTRRAARDLGLGGDEIDSLKKVKGKEIYIVDANAGTEVKILQLLESYGAGNKPFTVLSTKGADFVVSGSSAQNMMLITSGAIIFDATTACNGETAIGGHAGQDVRGIFYAKEFKTQNDMFNYWSGGNNAPENDVWCNYGNLHIKGVVIGNMEPVRKHRRSELYTWFNKEQHGKRDTVLYGASLLLENNPSLLDSDLPPGAEEFNKLLKTERE